MADLIDRGVAKQHIRTALHADMDLLSAEFANAICNVLDGMPPVDAIPIGEEFWMDRFDVRTRGWRADDGELLGVSFVITRKEAEDERTD